MAPVALFSGHMVDRVDRPNPRLPGFLVSAARGAIGRAIGRIPGGGSWAVSGAACGGDLLFCEAWLGIGRPLEVHLPQPVEPFLEDSVRFAGSAWVDLFHRVLTHPATTGLVPRAQLAPDHEMHTANNLEMIASATRDSGPIMGIFLWDGTGGDGPGGTAHMATTVEQRGGDVVIIDPADLVTEWVAVEDEPQQADLTSAYRLLRISGRHSQASRLAERFALPRE